MKSTMQIEKEWDGVRFSGFVAWDEFPRLDGIDAAVVADCGGKDRTAADWLLALEVIFRRAYEQCAAPCAKREEQ